MASRIVSATPAGSSAKAFSRSAETGRALAATMTAPWIRASSPLSPPSLRARGVAAQRGGEAGARSGQRLESEGRQQPGRAQVPRVWQQERVARPVQSQEL